MNTVAFSDSEEETKRVNNWEKYLSCIPYVKHTISLASCRSGSTYLDVRGGLKDYIDNRYESTEQHCPATHHST